VISVAVEFLTGVCRASSRHDRGAAEWPPHPDRLFMAMVAGHHECPSDAVMQSAERIALAWIESASCPEIAGGEPSFRNVVTTYVPTNDDAISTKVAKIGGLKDDGLAGQLRVLPDSRGRKAREFPAVVPADPRVHYIWRVQPSAEVARGLASLCAKVTRLGHSASLVRAWVDDSPPRASLEPCEEADAILRLRVPVVGRLSALEAAFAHDSSALVPASRSRGYRRCTNKAIVHRSRLAGSMIVLRRVAGVRVGLESTLQVCEVLRRSILKRCPQQPPPEWLCGHSADGAPSNRDHVAIVPLPMVGGPHADGHLLGLGVLVPEGIDVRERRSCLDAALTPDGVDKSLRLWGGTGGWFEWLVEPVGGHSLPAALQECTWSGDRIGSRRWASVTPVVLDRHSKSEAGIAASIAGSCERVGLPAPVSVQIGSVSVVPGVPPAWAMPTTRRGDGSARRHLHAVLEFAEPVAGPIAIGAGRFAGYGLLRPWQGGEGRAIGGRASDLHAAHLDGAPIAMGGAGNGGAGNGGARQ
jgi:CRISPR-associated protein Csb2